MNLENLRVQLDEVFQQGKVQKEVIDKSRSLLKDVLATQGSELAGLIKCFISAVLQDSVYVMVSRQVITDITSSLPSIDEGASKEVAIYLLESLQSRVISYEEQVVAIRQHLSMLYEKDQEWRQAADALVAIPLESGQKQYSNDTKLDIYLRIAQFYLEDEDPTQAEIFLNRAAVLRKGDPQNEENEIKYEACYARVLDYRRKFIEAAQRYNELSYNTKIHESERIDALKRAFICTILASAGRQRARMLAVLFKDERCQQLPAYEIIEKMYLDRIIRGPELEEFSNLLVEHQKATRADGSTILDRAVVEHNLIAVSKLYKNIAFDQLGVLLGIPENQAERVTSHMMLNGAMHGYIDQVDGYIHFQGEQVLSSFDEQIEGVCLKVNRIVDQIQEHEPGWQPNQNKATSMDTS